MHIYVPGAPDDPRSTEEAPNGIVIHRGPPLHPDDVAVVNGVPTTSVARTLIDLAEVCGAEELYGYFLAAHKRGLLDLGDLAAARGRLEWRPSLALVDEMIARFQSGGGPPGD
jgi:hypothetical protein